MMINTTLPSILGRC